MSLFVPDADDGLLRRIGGFDVELLALVCLLRTGCHPIATARVEEDALVSSRKIRIYAKRFYLIGSKRRRPISTPRAILKLDELQIPVVFAKRDRGLGFLSAGLFLPVLSEFFEVVLYNLARQG